MLFVLIPCKEKDKRNVFKEMDTVTYTKKMETWTCYA